MKRFLGTLAVILSFVSLYSTNALAFSVAAKGYSLKAFEAILASDAVMNLIPSGSSITSIEKVEAKTYRFEVKAGECSVTVDLDTTTPRGFIGNGFPHDPKVVDSDGCH
jgi:hypothetical protein